MSEVSTKKNTLDALLKEADSQEKEPAIHTILGILNGFKYSVSCDILSSVKTRLRFVSEVKFDYTETLSDKK